MSLEKAQLNVWDKDVPIQKSAYVVEDDIQVFNEENFKLEPNKPTMVDLFCGAGGFSVGCQWAGFQSILGIDYFKPAIDTWKYNHPNAISILGDIRKISPEFVKYILKRNGVEKVHLVTGGVPCQGFSRANRKHRDDDERNYLFLDYMKMVEALNPDYIILENVSGMKTTAGGKFVGEILGEMDELGYNARVELLNAAEFGVPQIRKRLIFVGIKRNVGLKEYFEYPQGMFIDSNDIDLFSIDEKTIFRTVWDAISDLPKIESGESADKYDCEPLNDYQRLMRGYSNELVTKKCVELFNHVAPNHPEETIKKIAETKPGQPMYPKFKQRIRLDYWKPSPTQLAGGIRPQFQFGHPELARGLTIRERARIQSFPDSYRFFGGTVQERVQTGNAVPPLLVYYIAKEIMNDLKLKYPSFNSNMGKEPIHV